MEPVRAPAFGGALRDAEIHPITPDPLGAHVVAVLGPPVVAVGAQGGVTQRNARIEPLDVRAEAFQRAWVALLGVWGGSVGYQVGLEHENPISEAAIEPPPAVFDSCWARALPSHTATVEEYLYPF